MAKKTTKNFNLHAPPGHPHGIYVYDDTFKLKDDYLFEIHPISTYWGFGIQLSKTKDFDAPSSEPFWNQDQLPSIFIWVTKMAVDTDPDYYALHNKFLFLGHNFLIPGFQFDDVGKKSAFFIMKNDNGKLFIETGIISNGRQDTRVDLGEFKYFKVIGFGEEKGFEIEVKMEIDHKDQE